MSTKETRGRQIRDLPEHERPRERALRNGVKSLKDDELIAIMIGNGTQGANALDLARELLRMRDGNLYLIYQELLNNVDVGVKGLGQVKLMQIAAAQELGIRTYLWKNKDDDVNNIELTNSQRIYNYIEHELIGKTEEEMWVIVVNNSGKPRLRRQISRGGLNNASADVRVILRTALQYSAVGIAVVHNHPGGSLKPSIQDDEFTRKLYKACRAVDIILLDHLIYTKESYYSYFDSERFNEFQ